MDIQVNNMFYYPEYTYLECLEQELRNVQREMKNDVGGIWEQRFEELKEEIEYWKHVLDYHGHSNRIGIVHNALNPRDLYLFLNDKENFDYVVQMKEYDVIFLERIYKSNDHIFDVYYIKDEFCMGALLKKYHAEWF